MAIWPTDSVWFFPIQEQNIITSLHTVKRLLPKPSSFAKIVTYTGSAVHFSQNVKTVSVENAWLPGCLYSLFSCVIPTFMLEWKKSKINKVLSSANVRKVFCHTQELGTDEALLNFFSLESHLYIFFYTLFLFVCFLRTFFLQFCSSYHHTANGKCFLRIPHCFVLRTLKLLVIIIIPVAIKMLRIQIRGFFLNIVVFS